MINNQYMRGVAKYIVYSIFRLWYWVRYPMLSIHEMSLYRVCISVSKNTKILGQGLLNKCSLQILGINNFTVINGRLSNCRIQIDGNNCKVVVHEKAKINNTIIIVRGDRCTVEIGRESTIGSACIVCMGIDNSITIGNACMLSENIDIWNTDSHPIVDNNGNIINPSKPIVIGNHVWIGKKVSVLKGVTIGDNSIIGMGSVVTKDIKDGTLNVGSPSHQIKENVNWVREFIEV